MAKRFTDTDKYKKPFLRGLQGAYKLLWDYICNDCNHAGIWLVDFEIAQIYLGKDIEVNEEDALNFFNAGEKRVLKIDDKRWFILSFIEFQYVELNPQNRAHLSVIKCLRSFNLWDDAKNKIKPLTSSLQGAMDMDMDKDKDMDKDLEEETREEFSFDEVWDLYDKKVGEIKKLQKKWIEVSETDRGKIFSHIPLYKKSQPNKKYRKNLETYLNNKSWNDEIIINNDNNGNGRNNGSPAKTVIPADTSGYKDSI